MWKFLTGARIEARVIWLILQATEVVRCYVEMSVFLSCRRNFLAFQTVRQTLGHDSQSAH